MASGTLIELFMGNEKIIFKSALKDSQEISLDRNKIISADHILGKDAKNQQMMAAIAGSVMVDGLYGACLSAAMPKEYYLVITYKSNDEAEFIMFDTRGSVLSDISENKVPVKKIVADINSKISIEQKVEL